MRPWVAPPEGVAHHQVPAGLSLYCVAGGAWMLCHGAPRAIASRQNMAAKPRHDLFQRRFSLTAISPRRIPITVTSLCLTKSATLPPNCLKLMAMQLPVFRVGQSLHSA